MDLPLVARRARVVGRVQGVYYRASTAAEARRLGVRGHARNLPDGAVDVLVVGPEPAVTELLRWLWHGPPLAQVSGVEVTEVDLAACIAMDGFATR